MQNSFAVFPSLKLKKKKAFYDKRHYKSLNKKLIWKNIEYVQRVNVKRTFTD